MTLLSLDTFSPSSFQDINFRPATLNDLDFYRYLHRITMKHLVEAYFDWNEEQQESLSRASFHPHRAWIVLRDSQDIGFLQINDTPSHVELEKLYILPKFHNIGIGTTIVNALIQHAEKTSKVLNLGVLKNNRAKGLYEKLGFTICGETHYKYMMQRNRAPSP